MLVAQNTNTKARCTGDDETPPRPGTRPVDAAQCAVEDTSIDGPEFAATPGVAARGPKRLARRCARKRGAVHVGAMTESDLLTYLLHVGW